MQDRKKVYVSTDIFWIKISVQGFSSGKLLEECDIIRKSYVILSKYLAIDSNDFARFGLDLDLNIFICSDHFTFPFQNFWWCWLETLVFQCRRKLWKDGGATSIKLPSAGPVFHPKAFVRFFVECNFVQILCPFSSEKKYEIIFIAGGRLNKQKILFVRFGIHIGW